MKIKQVVKAALADVLYSLYRIKDAVNGPEIHVMSIDETLDLLLTTDKSIVRFGDGELSIIRGKEAALQESDAELKERLKDILSSDSKNPMIALMDIFNGLDHFVPRSQAFWKDQLLFTRRIFKRLCLFDEEYANMSFTRPYITMADKSHCQGQFAKARQLFSEKRIFIVEGAATHNGVGNDLLSAAVSVRRLICPSSGAYRQYKTILTKCLNLVSKEELVLVSLGPAAKPLVFDLTAHGYRVIDIGNLDTEYEWFLMGAEEKTSISKHEVIGIIANQKAGYEQYLNEIVAIIE